MNATQILPTTGLDSTFSTNAVSAAVAIQRVCEATPLSSVRSCLRRVV
jgi:hypothetical protein